MFHRRSAGDKSEHTTMDKRNEYSQGRASNRPLMPLVSLDVQYVGFNLSFRSILLPPSPYQWPLFAFFTG